MLSKQKTNFQMNTETDDKIKVMATRIQVEKDPTKKQELQKHLRVLQFQKEIETIRKRIEQLGA